MNENEAKQAIKILFDKLIIVENNRLIYKQLTDLCGIGKQFEKVIIKSKNFWVLTIQSLKFTLITELAKIYDEHSKAFGIKKLINIFSQNDEWLEKWYNENGVTHKNFIKLLEEKYNGIKKKREKLKEIRDTELAHIDKKNILNSQSIYEDFTWGDVEDLIETARELINRISIGLTGNEYMIQLWDYDDVHYLVESAYKGMQNIEKLNS